MKYTSHNKKDFVKLTVRLTKDDYERFKKCCEIFGTSVNNEVNALVKKHNFLNRDLFPDDEIFK